MKSILDPTFPYRPSHNTDVTVSWERARQKIEEEKAKREEMRKKIEQLPTIGKKTRSL